MRGRWLRPPDQFLVVGVGLIMVVACAPVPPSVRPSAPTSQSKPGSGEAVLAAGDIAGCDLPGDEITADLVDRLLLARPGSVLALGDLAYPRGSEASFSGCYDPTWGRFRAETYPVPGNHDYRTLRAEPYFAYFGVRAGTPGEGWYSFEIGTWHVVALNSNCDQVGGCGSASDQLEWLAADLAAHPAECTLAYWHHPRWSSGYQHGSDDRTDAIWRLLADAGAEIVLNGHEHVYERFTPMDAAGAPDPDGLVEFVVGTGGRPLSRFDAALPTSAVRDNSTLGVLHLTLRPGGYDWEFVPTTPGGFTDAGSASC